MIQKTKYNNEPINSEKTIILKRVKKAAATKRNMPVKNSDLPVNGKKSKIKTPMRLR